MVLRTIPRSVETHSWHHQLPSLDSRGSPLQGIHGESLLRPTWLDSSWPSVEPSKDLDATVARDEASVAYQWKRRLFDELNDVSKQESLAEHPHGKPSNPPSEKSQAKLWLLYQRTRLSSGWANQTCNIGAEASCYWRWESSWAACRTRWSKAYKSWGRHRKQLDGWLVLLRWCRWAPLLRRLNTRQATQLDAFSKKEVRGRRARCSSQRNFDSLWHLRGQTPVERTHGRHCLQAQEDQRVKFRDCSQVQSICLRPSQGRQRWAGQTHTHVVRAAKQKQLLDYNSSSALNDVLARVLHQAHYARRESGKTAETHQSLAKPSVGI